VALRFIARGLKAKYKHEVQEIKALVGGLQKDDIAIDVGANKGGYLWSVSRAVPSGQVFAFEPQPIFFAYLRKVCPQAWLHNVHIEPFGLSDRPGVFTLAIPGSDPTSPAASFEEAVKSREPHQSYEVQVTTLDNYFENVSGHVGAIKIDVEGHELAVLRGGLNLLKKHKPKLG
jgi:FkbM family methyltransferase